MFAGGCLKQALIGCGKRDLLAQSTLETESRSQVNCIESPEGMPSDQITSEKENLIQQVHTNIGLPIAFELPAGQGICVV